MADDHTHEHDHEHGEHDHDHAEELDSAATKAAWKCLYRPAIQNGHPLSVWVTYPVAFRLK